MKKRPGHKLRQTRYQLGAQIAVCGKKYRGPSLRLAARKLYGSCTLLSRPVSRSPCDHEIEVHGATIFVGNLCGGEYRSCSIRLYVVGGGHLFGKVVGCLSYFYIHRYISKCLYVYTDLQENKQDKFRKNKRSPEQKEGIDFKSHHVFC